MAPDSTPRDTIKGVVALPERPRGPLTEGHRTRWDRDAIFASGALTLAELVALVPGASVQSASFIAGVTATSWYGEPGRVRVFVDGVELDVLDPRVGGSVDLATIPLWPMEEVVMERGAGELRVHLRSWRVVNTTAQTRTDILTGSENSNLYRGFYGKRFDGGGVLQLAGQQFSTTSARTRGDGDGLTAFARIGTVRGRLTLDAVALRAGRSRTPTRRYIVVGTPDETAIGSFRGRDLTAYLRAAWGDVDADGWWAQGIAATIQHIEDDSVAAGAAIPDPDTLVTQSQFVGSVGVNRGALRVSASARYRTQGGETRVSPSVRASYERGIWSASAYAEQGGPDSTSRLDGALRVSPLPWLYLAGAISQQRPSEELAGGSPRGNLLAVVGVTHRARTLELGVLRRSEALVLGMPVFDADYTPVTVAAGEALQLALRGQIYGPFSLDVRALQWSEAAIYRPENEVHTALRVETSLLEKLPRGTFHLSAALTHDWRATMLAPDGAGGTVQADGASFYGTILDIRIGSAHLFWYNRNFTGKVYETVPGYLMPRLVQLYGIRWEFWN